MKPRTRRHLVLATLPRLCPVCDGDGVVALVRVHRARGAAQIPCAHCVDHLPVLHLPFRIDHPGGAA